MGRPVKIHKKKSFMFTTKHTPFLGVMGIVIAALTIAITITIVFYSYHMNGDVGISFGGIGLSLLLLNIIGLAAGILGIRERDVFITPPIIAMASNGLMLLVWIGVIILSVKGM